MYREEAGPTDRDNAHSVAIVRHWSPWSLDWFVAWLIEASHTPPPNYDLDDHLSERACSCLRTPCPRCKEWLDWWLILKFENNDWRTDSRMALEPKWESHRVRYEWISNVMNEVKLEAIREAKMKSYSMIRSGVSLPFRSRHFCPSHVHTSTLL